MKKILLVLLILGLIVGCAPVNDDPAPTPSDPVQQTDPDPEPQTDPQPVTQPQGLSLDEFMDRLTVNSRYDGPNYYYITVKKPDSIAYMKRSSSVYVGGTIDRFEHVSGNTYRFKIQVPAFEGNEMIEAHDAFEVPMEITLSDDDPAMITVISDDPNGYFYAQAPIGIPDIPENGLSLEEFTAILAGSDYFYGPDRYFIEYHKPDRTSYGLDQSGYSVSGTIENFSYLGDNTYSYSLSVPGFEGNEMIDSWDTYEVPFTVRLNPSDRTVIDVNLSNADTAEFSGRFSALNWSKYYTDYELRESEERIPFDSHHYGLFHGKRTPVGFGYYIDLFGDEGQIDSGIFSSNAEKRHIFSLHYGACVNFYRVYDTLIIDSDMGGNENLHCVELIDCRTDEIVMTFDNVYFEPDFFAGTGSYDFKITFMADEASSTMHVDEYIITQSGVHKTNF